MLVLGPLVLLQCESNRLICLISWQLGKHVSVKERAFFVELELARLETRVCKFKVLTCRFPRQRARLIVREQERLEAGT